jgi:hypothetical protein
MHESCLGCGADLRRESGFYLGSIYVNYGLTSLVIAVAYPLLLFNGVLPEAWLLGIALTFVILFPIGFFRHARALWVGFDQFVDPRAGETGTGRDSTDEPRDDS